MELINGGTRNSILSEKQRVSVRIAASKHFSTPAHSPLNSLKIPEHSSFTKHTHVVFYLFYWSHVP